MEQATHHFTLDDRKIYINLKPDSYDKGSVDMLFSNVWCTCPFGGKEEHWNLTKI